MDSIRSDLAIDAAEQLSLTGKNAKKLSGVYLSERSRDGFHVTAITVENEAAGRTLGKPPGQYITVDLRPYFLRQRGFFTGGIACLRREFAELLPRPAASDTVLVVGLGNRNLICDAVGPKTVEHLLVTRHLPGKSFPFSSVAALTTGVVGQTGIETRELVEGVVHTLSPAAVIVVDALCARSASRLCTTVQLSDTGLVPGSGVGNHRAAINRETLGVPVVAVGIPTVIADSTLAGELSGKPTQKENPLFLTPRDIDSRVTELSRLLGYGITAALQPSLTAEDITGLLG